VALSRGGLCRFLEIQPQFRRVKQMDEDRIKGSAKQAKGAVKEAVGQVTGEPQSDGTVALASSDVEARLRVSADDAGFFVASPISSAQGRSRSSRPANGVIDLAAEHFTKNLWTDRNSAERPHCQRTRRG
jgi:uncharacterized protein YjbJ (UPF0337 family)